MGNSINSVQQFVDRLNKGPDMTVNRNLKMFSSLNSSDHLRRHYEQRRMAAGDCAADWTKSLVEKLAGLSGVELAGLGALAIAILIDIISFSPPEESMKDALRCVFAEEKASEVWDQIDECLKRCTMHLNNTAELVSDLKRIEGQLSTAITKLKNSMVRDGHMTNQALKAWVNGAAFHIQLLIHQMRLVNQLWFHRFLWNQSLGPVERLLSTYRSDLDLLSTKHREMVEGKCDEKSQFVHHAAEHAIYFRDENSRWHRIESMRYNRYLEAYYEYRYGGQKSEIEQYFSDVRNNLQELVNQRGSFQIN